MAFQPVPTYESPADVDPKTGKFQFSPTWLSWFLSLTNGGLSNTIKHNALQGLQGGALNQFYHLTFAQYNSIPYRNTSATSTISPSGSPFTYTNADAFDEDVVVQGGTVTKIEFIRSSVATDIGLTQGPLRLSIGDAIRVTYTGTPNMTKVPR